MAEAEEKTPPDYVRINVAAVTPKTAPPYAAITHTERTSRYVLSSEDGTKLLIGDLGVNYFMDGPATRDAVYLRRWDQPPFRGDGYRARG
jgi:hypothetical protein